MTKEEEDILSKMVEIGVKRMEIEDYEKNIGLVTARDELTILLDELETLQRTYP